MMRSSASSSSTVTVSSTPLSKATIKKFCKEWTCSYPKNTVVVVNQPSVSPVFVRRNATTTFVKFVNLLHNTSLLMISLTLKDWFWLAQLWLRHSVMSRTFLMRGWKLLYWVNLMWVMGKIMDWIRRSLRVRSWWAVSATCKKRK